MGKRLELLQQLVPGLRRVGYLHVPDSPIDDASFLKYPESTCSKLNCKVVLGPVRAGADVARAFELFKREKVDGLVVSGISNIINLRTEVIERAAQHRLAAVYIQSLFVESGGLISYSPNFTDLFRRAPCARGEDFQRGESSRSAYRATYAV